MEKKTIEQLESVASQVRRDILRMVHAVQSGHPGASLGCTEFFVALYFNRLNHDSNFKMEGKGEDLFFLSNGHISPVWYSVLSRSGYFSPEEMNTFRKLNSRLQGHPATEEGLPGIRIASGSLGQGMSVAIGAAQAKKIDGDDSTVYILMGDGEQEEGQVWEAAMYAAHWKVDNLIATIDLNRQQIDGPTREVVDTLLGNDMKSVLEGLEKAKNLTREGKPVLNLLHTEMGYGVDFMVGTHKWHGIAPSDEQLADALGQLPETIGDY